MPRAAAASPLSPQAGNSTFNRAKLLNVGVKEALKDEEWDCLFLHDVDLIPENDHNLYTCDPWNPKHVSIAMNKFGYRWVTAAGGEPGARALALALALAQRLPPLSQPAIPPVFWGGLGSHP